MTQRLEKIRVTLLLVLAAVVAAFGLIAYELDLFRRLELDSVDARFSIRGDKDPPKDMVVVAVDDTTFSELGLQWPLPRSVHAQVIRKLNRDGAKVIAYDVQFSERTNLSGLVAGSENRQLLEDLSLNEDEALLQAEDAAHGKVVLSTTEVGDSGEPNVLGGKEALEYTGSRAGNTNVPPDPEGVLRRFPYAVDRLKSFAVVVAEVADNRRISRGSFGDKPAWIDFRGPPGTVPSVPFSRVVNDKTPRGFFRDKIVIVGASAPSLQDLHSTATGEAMPGAEVQANAISTIRNDLPLDSSPGVLTVLLILLGSVGPPLMTLRRSRARVVFLATVLAAAAYVLIVQLAFNSGTILPVVYPLACLALSSVGTLAVHYGTAAVERRHVRDVFSRFVPEQVVDEALDAAGDNLRLPAVRRQCTVLFADLRGFTSFAELLQPERVIDVLNRYLTDMSDVILDRGGTLVAYMGDGIMAVFGAPIEQTDHADRALAAARDMVNRLEGFNEWIKEEGLGEGFRMGIGVNSGTVMSGNIGSERRMEYTAIGDTTNAAARLEAMTKETPYQVLVSDSTRTMLRGDAPDLVYVDAVPVRGKVVKANLWSLAEPAGPERIRSRHASRSSETAA